MWEGGLHDLAAGDGGKIILGGPCLGVELAHGGNLARLERLEQHICIAVEVDLDLVVIMRTSAERHLGSPIVRVARQGYVPPGLKVADHIGATAQWNVGQRCIGEVFALPLCLAQDRTHARQQGQLAVVAVKGHAQAAGAGLLNALNLLAQPVVARVAL